MSKRFTETDKWRDGWFRKLSPTHKCLWSYMTDNCDQAGVIEMDWELASFQIGAKVKAEDLAAFGRQVSSLPCGKLLIHGFIEFQYGTPTPSCKPHGPIFKALERHGLTIDSIKERLSKPLGEGPIAFERLQEKEKEKDKETEQDSAPPPPAAPKPVTADQVYDAYPRKEARKQAVAAIDRAARGCAGGMPYLLERSQLYAKAVSQWPADERHYVPHPATWFNRGSFDDDPSLWVRHSRATLAPAQQQRPMQFI